MFCVSYGVNVLFVLTPGSFCVCMMMYDMCLCCCLCARYIHTNELILCLAGWPDTLFVCMCSVVMKKRAPTAVFVFMDSSNVFLGEGHRL